MKEAVYCTAIATGDDNEWNFGWERYKNSNVATEKDILLTALSCSKEKWILKRLLYFQHYMMFGIFVLNRFSTSIF